MFEDSTFESTGRIHTRSRSWMIASSAFNGSILMALVLIPLIYPHALPQLVLPFLVEVPQAPAPAPKPIPRPQQADLVKPQMSDGHIFAPTMIPPHPYIAERPEALPPINVGAMDEGIMRDGNNPFGSESHHPVVQQRVTGPVRVSGMIVEGMIVQKTLPAYPIIAKETGTQGTVVMQATISRAGTIENLRAVSGPPMLQRAALDAVKEWRYRPYLLSGEPVEVETTINVVFKLQN